MDTSGGDEHSQAVTEALSRAEALARQEVEAAQAGAAAERAARADAEAALSQARASLRHTNERLHESLANGPRAALAALLEEKEAAEAAAVKAVEEAAAGTRELEKKNRGEELSVLTNQRDEARECLVGERRIFKDKKREFRAALGKARSDALTSRARASALQQKLDQADVSGLQATIASLASDKAAAQSHAVELEARLARVAADHRRRSEKSRRENAVAADRLSAAEARARAAEARVETVVRHLTFSERRLREAERRVAESGRRKVEGQNRDCDADDAVENTASHGGVRMDGEAKGYEKPGRGSARDAALVRHKAAGCSGSRRTDGNEEDSCGTQEQPPPSGGTEDHSQSRKRVSGAATGERQWHGDTDTTALQENRDPAGSPAVAFGRVASSGNEDTTSILREVEVARWQVAVAEQQAATFRVDANRVKAEAAKASAEADIGKERAMMESERLARELKATEIEVNALKCALNSARKEHAEMPRMHQGPRTDFQPPELSGNQETAMMGGENNGAGKDDTPATATASRDPPPPGGQQPPRHVHLQETPLASITTRVREHDNTGVPGERSTSNSIRSVKGTKQIVGVSALAATNADQPDDTHVLLPDTHGTCGARGEEAAALMPPPGDDVRNAEPNPRPQSEQIVEELPQHPELVLRQSEALSPRTAQAKKIRKLGRDLAETRATADAATVSRRRAEGKVAELEEVIAESERQHELLRERGEARLETLKRAFAQEQEEGGAHIALAALLEEKSRAEARASKLEQSVNEMTAAVHAAHMEADQLKTEFKNQQFLADKAHDQTQEETTALPATDVDGMRRAPIPGLATTMSREDCHMPPCSTLARPSKSTANVANNSITPYPRDGSTWEEEEREKAGDATTAAHGQHDEATISSSTARLAEMEDRADSAEKALSAARNSSKAAMGRAKLLEQQLQQARAEAGAEAEGKHLAHARITELERDIHLMGVEQEAIRVRAETRLESLRAAFDQEELEAGGKAALECLLDEKVELARRAAELEARLHEAEATAAAAAAAATAGRTTGIPAEERGTPEPGLGARAGEAADHGRGGDGNALETTVANTGGQSPEGREYHAGAEETTAQHHPRHQELLLRQAEIDASRSTAEADRLRGELEDARAEQARAAIAAAEEREASARRISELQVAIEQTKREYRDHRDRAESRLETLRVAFDQENEENDPQATLAALLEEKGQAEERAADAYLAADEIRSEMELVRKRAEEVIRASERQSVALRANAAGETAARILAEIDSKYNPATDAFAGCKPVVADADVDGDRRDETFGGGELENATAIAVGEIHRRFESTHEAARTAGAKAIKAEIELDRVRGEAEAALHQQREASSALVTEAQRAAGQASAAAAERVAAGECALQKAKAEVGRLREELERAREMDAANQAAAAAEKEERKIEVSGKIAQLEGDLREAVTEHQRSRQQAELEIERLRAALERREEPERLAIAEGTGSAPGAQRAAASVVAAMAEPPGETEVVAEQRRRVEASRDELRIAEQTVTEAKQEVESLRGELARTVEAAVSCETRQKVAETRIAELEAELEEAAREHVLFREEAEERLRVLRASFEEENTHNGAQAALTALLQDKHEIERRTADQLIAAGKVRSDLELQLGAANDALAAAKGRLNALGLAKAATGDADGAGDGGCIGQEGLDNGLNGEAGHHGERGRTPTTSVSRVLQPGEALRAQEEALRAQEGEVLDDEQRRQSGEAVVTTAGDGCLRTELGRAHDGGGAAAVEATAVTQETVSELDRAAHEIERTRALLAEARLEEVQRQLRQEELEGRTAQTGMAVLLEEKREAEVHAVDAKLLLDEARAAATRAAGKVDDLETELRDAANRHVVDSIACATGKGRAAEEVRATALQAAEQLASKEAMLREADQALESSRGEAEGLRRGLERARTREREAATAVEEERRAAQGKIAVLESAIERSEREHALLRERTEGRMELLRSAMEQEEEENASQAALAELLEQKSQADDLAAELEEKLHHADGALQEAETRAASLKDALDEAEAKATAAEEAACLAAAEGAVGTIVAAAIAAAERLHHVGATSSKDAYTATPDASRAECETFVTEEYQAAHVTQTEMGRLRQEVGRARANETTARDEAAAARARLSELEEAMEESQRSHDSFRERTERRLESLRHAVEDEELEQGAQAALECLLHEKDQEQAKVADLETRLLEACEAVRTTEGQVRTVREELERVERANAELMESSAAMPPSAPSAAVALINRERLEARLDRLQVAVEEEEEENGVQASLSVLLEEKWKLESRVLELEVQLREANEAIRRGEEAEAINAAAAGKTEETVADRVDVSTETSTPPLTTGPSTADAIAHGIAAGSQAPGATATAAAAAAARAAKAETALSEALEAVEELEARCAAAQARESEAVRQADARVEELVRERDEANGQGAKAALRALLEELALRPSDPATAVTAAAGAVEVDDGEDLEGPEAEDNSDHGQGSPSVGSSGDAYDSEDGAGEGGTILALLAQRDELLRENERLQQQEGEKLYARHDAKYRHTVDVGRYELSLDILEEDLEHARAKLEEAVQLRSEDDEQLERLLQMVCQRAKKAEDDKKRADEQLAETQEQLALACRALDGATEDLSITDCCHRRPDNVRGQQPSTLLPTLTDVPAQQAQTPSLPPSAVPPPMVEPRPGYIDAVDEDERIPSRDYPATATPDEPLAVAVFFPAAVVENGAGEEIRLSTPIQCEDGNRDSPERKSAPPTGTACASDLPSGREPDVASSKTSGLREEETVVEKIPREAAEEEEGVLEAGGGISYLSLVATLGKAAAHGPGADRTAAVALSDTEASGEETPDIGDGHGTRPTGTRPTLLAIMPVPSAPVPDSEADGKGVLGLLDTEGAGEKVTSAAEVCPSEASGSVTPATQDRVSPAGQERVLSEDAAPAASTPPPGVEEERASFPPSIVARTPSHGIIPRIAAADLPETLVRSKAEGSAVDDLQDCAKGGGTIDIASTTASTASAPCLEGDAATSAGEPVEAAEEVTATVDAKIEKASVGDLAEGYQDQGGQFPDAAGDLSAAQACMPSEVAQDNDVVKEPVIEDSERGLPSIPQPVDGEETELVPPHSARRGNPTFVGEIERNGDHLEVAIETEAIRHTGAAANEHAIRRGTGHHGVPAHGGTTFPTSLPSRSKERKGRQSKANDDEAEKLAFSRSKGRNANHPTSPATTTPTTIPTATATATASGLITSRLRRPGAGKKILTSASRLSKPPPNPGGVAADFASREGTDRTREGGEEEQGAGASLAGGEDVVTSQGAGAATDTRGRTQKAASPSVGTSPSSTLGRRRSSDALFGLRRLSSIHTIREMQQQQQQQPPQHRRQQTAPDPQREEHNINRAAAAAQPSEGGELEGSETRPRSRSSSPDSRGGKTVSTVEAPRREGGKTEKLRGDEKTTGSTTASSEEARAQGGSFQVDYPPSSPEARGRPGKEDRSKDEAENVQNISSGEKSGGKRAVAARGIGRQRTRADTPSSSPESRKGTLEVGVAAPTKEEENVWHPSLVGSGGPAVEETVAAVTSAANAIAAQRRSERDKPESRSSSPESRSGATSVEAVARQGEVPQPTHQQQQQQRQRQQRRREQQQQQQQQQQQHRRKDHEGRSPDSSAATKSSGAEARRQLEVHHDGVSDGGSEESAAAAVRTKSTNHKRGHSAGILSPVRGAAAVAHENASRKTTKKGRVRSESPPARG
eukprot:g10598.t1